MNEEGMQDTPNKLIHIGKPIEFDMERFEGQLEELYVTANEDGDGIAGGCDADRGDVSSGGCKGLISVPSGG